MEDKELLQQELDQLHEEYKTHMQEIKGILYNEDGHASVSCKPLVELLHKITEIENKLEEL